MAGERAALDILPAELWEAVFLHLRDDSWDLVRLTQAAKAFNQIILPNPRFPLTLSSRPDTVTDGLLTWLAGVRWLRIDRGCAVSDAGLAALGGVHHLDVWNVRGLVTDVSLRALRGVQVLLLSPASHITDEGVAHLAGIHTLFLEKCKRLTDTSLQALAGVQELSLCGCPRITDAGLAHLAGARKVHLYQCDGITDAGIVQLAPAVGRLLVCACCAVEGACVSVLRGLDMAVAQTGMALIFARTLEQAAVWP